MRRILLALLTLALLTVGAQAQVGSNSACLTLFLPTPLSTGNTNIWGASINTDMTQIDQASAGFLSLNLPAASGYPTVALVSSTNAVDQARNAHFAFSGTLTSNTLVLWPASLCRTFTVSNISTGAFSLTLGVNNGSGGASGSTVVVSQGQTVYAYSDGTNIVTLSTTTTGYFYGGTSSGTTAQVVSAAVPSGFTLTQGYFASWLAGGTTTGATTLAYAGTSATTVQKQSPSGLVALVNNDIVAGQVYTAVYDGTFWQLLNPSSGSAIGGSTINLSAALNEAKATVASGGTTAIGAAAGNYIAVTGTTTITAFDTVQAGAVRVLEFAGILTLTQSSAIILPNSTNITTAAGDVAIFVSEGSGNWRLVNYSPAAGTNFLGTPQTYSASHRLKQAAVTISTATFTPSFDGVQDPVYTLSSACPCTIANPSTTPAPGQHGVIAVVQDGTGSRTVTWGSQYKFGGGTAPTLSTGAGAVDLFAYYVYTATQIIVSGGVLNAH